MARGDIVSDLGSIADTARFTYQPASGVEVVIKSLITGKVAGTALNIEGELYDGALTGIFWSGNHTLAVIEPYNIAILVNNSIYLRILNNAGVTATLGFTGMQTK